MDELVFPAWFFGPNGEAEIFEAEESVPKGWSRWQGKATVDVEPETGESAPKREASSPEVKRRGRPPKAATEVTEDEF